MASSKPEPLKSKLINVTDDLQISYFEKIFALKCDEENDWINKSFFPDDITLALLARASYKDEPQDLPDGWKLMMTATNKKDGYFGAAFLNIEEYQLVVAHRGTKLGNIGAVLTDIEGVIYNQFTCQMDSASSFTAFVLAKCDLQKLSVTFTGHSLGAWLAQITTFTAKYLTITHTGFVKNNPNGCKFHPHTVVFDSPGCYDMLARLSENYYHRYESKAMHLINCLDIRCYLSAPNLINTCNRHAGNLYRVYPPLPDWGLKWAAFVETLTKHPHEAVTYSLLNHGIKNIILALKEGYKVPRILDWPLLTWSTGSRSKVPIPSSFFLKFLKLFKRVGGLVYEKIFNLNNEEYKVFFEFANRSNNYNPAIDLTANLGDIILHYKVGENRSNECSISIFNQDELVVLESWLIIKNKKIYPTVVERFFSQFGLGNPHKFFNIYSFYIQNDSKIITCDSNETLKLVINNIKHIMLYFPHLKDAMTEQVSSVPQLVDALLCSQVKDYLYLNKIGAIEINFIDKLGIKQFLESKDSIMYVQASYPDVEPKRIYSILCKLCGKVEFPESQFLFLSWHQLLHLDSTIGISSISKQSFEVVVLDCVEINDEEFRDLPIINKLFERSNEVCLKKMIVIDNGNRTWKDIFAMIQQPYRECTIEGQLWDCISSDTQEKIIEKCNINFRNSAEKTSLKNIVGFDELNTNHKVCFGEILDDETVIKLMNNETLDIGDKALGLSNLNESFSQVYRPVSKNILINYLLTDFPSCDLATIIVSGVGQSEDESLNNKLIELLELEGNDLEKRLKGLVGTVNEKDKRLLIAPNNFESFDFQQICSTLPRCLVYWIKCVNNKFMLKEIYNSNFFMDREFIIKSKVIVTHHLRDELIKRDINEIYIFNNCNRYDLSRFFCISERNDKDSFLKNYRQGSILCCDSETEADLAFEEIQKEKNVHMFSFESGELIWKKSDGSLSTVTKYFDIDNSSEVSTWTNEFISNVNDKKVVILAGDAGIGKTTVSLKISEIMQSNNWVIFINLKYCKLAIKQLPSPSDKITLEQVLQFIIDVCGIHRTNSLEVNLIKFKMNVSNEGKRLILFFDGFDEIKDRIGKSKVLKVLQFLRGKTPIWVNTRNHYVEELQNDLCVIPIKLREFNMVEQKEYLLRFWQSRLRLSVDSDLFSKFFLIDDSKEKSKFDTFVDILLKNVKENFEQKVAHILQIPLQMRFIAEVFENIFYNFMMSNGCFLDFGTISFLALFREFVNLKISIYLSEKLLLSLGNSVSEEWFKEPIIKRHFHIAFFEMFPEHSETFIMGKPPFRVDPVSRILMVDNKETEELLRVGFIHLIKNNSYEFTYQIIAEYFCAEYIFKFLNHHLDGNRKSLLLVEFLVGNILLKPEFKSVHLFLNERLKCNNFSKEVLVSYGNHLALLWTNNPHSFINESYQNAFHIISRTNHLNILKFLLSCLIASSKLENCINFIFTRNLQGETALYEAAKFNFETIIDEYCSIMENSCTASSIKKALLATIFKEEQYKCNWVIKNLINQVKSYPELDRVYCEIEESFPNIESFFKLIKNGDINNTESTLLEITPDTCKYLLLSVDSCGNTLLHSAAYYSKWNIFQFLLKFYSNTDLDYIMVLKNEAEQSVMKFIVEKSKIRNMNVVGSSVLRILENVSVKKRYPLLMTTNSEGMTILHLTAEDEQWEIILKLIDSLEMHYQAEAMNARDVRGKSVLNFAVLKGGLRIVNEFVERGADMFDVTGCSALHEAVCNPDKTVLLYILKACNKKLAGDPQKVYSFVNSRDRKGDTPLMWAAERGDIDAVMLLLSEPTIDIDVKNNVGKTALMWASDSHCNSIVELLQAHKEKCDQHIIFYSQ